MATSFSLTTFSYTSILLENPYFILKWNRINYFKNLIEQAPGGVYPPHHPAIVTSLSACLYKYRSEYIPPCICKRFPVNSLLKRILSAELVYKPPRRSFLLVPAIQSDLADLRSGCYQVLLGLREEHGGERYAGDRLFGQVEELGARPELPQGSVRGLTPDDHFTISRSRGEVLRVVTPSTAPDYPCVNPICFVSLGN